MIDLEKIKNARETEYSFFETKYLSFTIKRYPKRKTPITAVFNKDMSLLLGEIKYYPAWRRFVFYPSENTLFDSSCLNSIETVIHILEEERKNGYNE